MPEIDEGTNQISHAVRLGRIGIVAKAICKGLCRNTGRAAVENCRKMNMYLDDLKCCEATCGETC